MKTTTWLLLALALSGGAALADPLPTAAQVMAQSAVPVNLRDPTELPLVLRQAPAPDGTAGAAADIAVQQLMVVDGRYFVVAGGRRLRVGDKLGAARIARIEDSAVWLTEDGVTRKQSLFAGVEKRAERWPAAPAALKKPINPANSVPAGQTKQTAPSNLPQRPSRAATPRQENP